MIPDTRQTIEEIDSYRVLERAGHLKHLGYRLVEMHCTRLPQATEINYVFDLDGDLVVFRAKVGDEASIPSLTGIYGCAFLYENEMQDLFGIRITDIAVDFKGHFYKLKTQTPYKTDTVEEKGG